MTYAKTILITTESHEIFALKMKSPISIRGFCEQCADEVELLTFDEAISVSKVNARELFGQIETKTLHSIEALSGHLLVCLSSLSKIKT